MDDEQLVAQFFNENAFEVADNGFSRRVSQHLPQRRLWLNRLWTLVCAVALVAFLLLSDAKEQLLTAFGKLAGELSRLVPAVNFSWSTLGLVLILFVTLQWIVVHEVLVEKNELA